VSNFTIRVPKTRFREARLFATLSLLEYFEKRKIMATSRNPLRALGSRDFLATFEWFLKFDGLRRIRVLPDVAEFEAALLTNRAEAKSTARLLDFSLRVDLADIRSKRLKPAITMAKHILAEGEHGTNKKIKFLDNDVSFSELGRRWSLFKQVSIAHFLYYRNRLPKCYSIKSKNFAPRLLQLADDGQGWQQFAPTEHGPTNGHRVAHAEPAPSPRPSRKCQRGGARIWDEMA
jgi:hypothetical protein